MKKENLKVIGSFVFVVAVIFLIVFSLLNKKENKEEEVKDLKINKQSAQQGQQNMQNENSDINNNSNNLNMNEQSNQKLAKNGDTLVMNYTGRLTNGTVFDSNVDPKFGHVEPFEFVLGQGQVIAGWDEGLVGMKIGEKKTLTIPPEKGYGSRAVSSIPANSTLVFDVELVGIK